MRFTIPNIISEEDLALLSRIHINKSIRDWNEPLIKRVFTKIKEETDIELCDKSYWRVESKSQGHGWHVDTGNSNHMAWCRIGCSILLSGSFEGGVLRYRDEDIEQEMYTLYGHGSDVEHMVTPHSPEGSRRVLLLFI
jgi:hypothetical protein